jgi:hypothetical protein
MTEEEYEKAAAALAGEAEQLRQRLRTLEQIVHGKLLPNAEEHLGRIAAVERQITDIVLRLSQIDREQTELRIARVMGS